MDVCLPPNFTVPGEEGQQGTGLPNGPMIFPSLPEIPWDPGFCRSQASAGAAHSASLVACLNGCDLSSDCPALSPSLFTLNPSDAVCLYVLCTIPHHTVGRTHLSPGSWGLLFPPCQLHSNSLTVALQFVPCDQLIPCPGPLHPLFFTLALPSRQLHGSFLRVFRSLVTLFLFVCLFFGTR